MNELEKWVTIKEVMKMYDYKSRAGVQVFTDRNSVQKKTAKGVVYYWLEDIEKAKKEEDRKNSYRRVTHDTENDSKELVIKWLNTEPLTISELSRRLDRSKETIIRILDEIHKNGIDIKYDDASKQAAITKTPHKFVDSLSIEPFYKNKLKIGCVSDTHFGSFYQQLTLLRTAYKIFDQEKVDFITHSGDLSEGYGMFPDQPFECHKHGFDDIKEYIINVYPTSKRGIKSYLIGGSHDMSYKKKGGANIVRGVCEKRDDLIYRGEESASFSVSSHPWFTLNLLHPSGGLSYARCFDDTTEILTKDGFKFFKDLKDTDEYATLNPENHYLEYQKSTERQVYDWDGDLYHFFGKSFDLLVTPEHSLYVRRSANRLGSRTRKDLSSLSEKQQARYKREHINTDWQRLNAKDIFSSWKKQLWQMTKTCTWVGKEQEFFDLPPIVSKTPHVLTGLPREKSNLKHFGRLKMDDWLEFLGWYVSEGSASGSGISISQVKDQQKRKEIFDICTRLNFNPTLTDVAINMYGKELVVWLRENIGTNSFTKRIPSWCKELSSRQINIFLQSYLKGDGWKTNPESPHHQWSIKKRWAGCKSASDLLLDDLQECLLKVGLSGTKNTKQISLTVTNESLTPDLVKKPELVPYVGKVYDVTVPNHIILVRRNGKIIWSGNSYKTQKQTEALVSDAYSKVTSFLLNPDSISRDQLKAPMLLLVGHYHISNYLPRYLGVDSVMLPCFQAQTPYLKRGSLFPQIGFLILTIEFDDTKNVTKIIPDFRWLDAYVKENDY